MEQNGGSWPPGGGGREHPAPSDGHQQSQPSHLGGYNPPHLPLGGQVSLPPPGPFQGAQPGTSALANLAGLARSSPQQQTHYHSQHQQQSPTSSNRHNNHGGPPLPPPGSNLDIPSLSQMAAQDRDRSFGEMDAREAEERLRREQLELQERARIIPSGQQPSPPEAHASNIPLQQPMASRVSQTLHGPSGLLGNNPNVNIGALMGAPPGPPTSFPGGPGQDPLRAAFGHPGLPPQVQALAGPGMHQLANGNSALAQSQQPILNDALTYLDQVKVRFQDQPDVYNKFLDIMKDFKSQAIDTPGVIARVSRLFSGHPQLIQGFNTFLPPGYKIEAGWNNDPNNIRVTTPAATHVYNTLNMDDGIDEQIGLPLQRAGHIENGYRNQQIEEAARHAQEQAFGSDSPYTPSQPRIHHGAYGLVEAQRRLEEEELSRADAALAHRQEQNVAQLSNAVNVAREVGPAGLSAMQTSPQQSRALPPTQAQAQYDQDQGGDKKPPVEFNHAISYVNKIKNRFAGNPEVYKQFLEILQLYQRDSKPIQDVYAQVTQLFRGAQDLLDDFKQFLPESAAAAQKQARAEAEAPAISNIRGEPTYRQAQTPRPEGKMPPLGNFAPSSVPKESKKRPRPGDKPSASQAGPSGDRDRNMQPGPASKRPKVAPSKPSAQEIAILSPSLVPDLPAPLPPTSTTTYADEHSFFDRVKKYIGNKTTYNEFLKLLNLYTQDNIDKNQLVDQMAGFIGHNPDLMGFVKRWISYTGKDLIIENKPGQLAAKVSLSNCRGLGPSYRMLPKRERQAKCSGRDEMCFEVLNDAWASHPTWASEDSGFVAHRKNSHEEAMHRMEEERHDYDFNIETALRTIQLLEPIVTSINTMSDDSKPMYRLPPGLGGQSETIWQRVIKKLYERSTGQKIIDDMQARPARVAPFLLVRLKEKVEKWKHAQREWEKIWRDQTHKQFWKSLDHQGLGAKADNKKIYQTKVLQTDISAKQTEQANLRRKQPGLVVPAHQLDFVIDEREIVYDAAHLLLTYIHQNTTHVSHADRVEDFLITFLSSLFGMDHAAFKARMADVNVGTPPNEEADEEPSGAEETTMRGRGRGGKRERPNMRKQVLTGKHAKDRNDSKESTPAVESAEDESSVETPSEQADKMDLSKEFWLGLNHDAQSRGKADPNTPYTRTNFKLYANVNIYCFIRVFYILYERLLTLKQWEAVAAVNVERALEDKAAIGMALAERPPTDFFEDCSKDAEYYPQVIKMMEDVLKGDIEMVQLDDCLRRYYLYCGWQLYGFDKMLGAVAKYANTITENKDRSIDIVNLFYRNRKEVETTPRNEIGYRKQAEKYNKDGEDMYKITWGENTKHLTIQLFKKFDPTLDMSDASAHDRWSYYVTSYKMMDGTEGVPPADIRHPNLKRNMPTEAEMADDVRSIVPEILDENLMIEFADENYKINFSKDPEGPASEDYIEHSRATRRRVPTGDRREYKLRRRRDFERKMREKAVEGLGGQEQLASASVEWIRFAKGEDAARDYMAQQQTLENDVDMAVEQPVEQASEPANATEKEPEMSEAVEAKEGGDKDEDTQMQD